MANKKPLALIIMDGRGDNPVKEFNAVEAAKTPVLDDLVSKYANTDIQASGIDVGLPDAQPGGDRDAGAPLPHVAAIAPALGRVARAGGHAADQAGLVAVVLNEPILEPAQPAPAVLPCPHGADPDRQRVIRRRLPERERGHVRERIAEHEPVVFGQHHPILPAASAPRRMVSDDATA